MFDTTKRTILQNSTTAAHAHVQRLTYSRQELAQSVATLKKYLPHPPVLAVIAGSGMSSLCDEFSVHARVPYSTLPLLPPVSVEGHRGDVIVSTCAGATLLLFAGRFHIYEGLSVCHIAAPIVLAHALGIRNVLLTNAAGALNPRYQVGEIVIVVDVLNMTFRSLATLHKHTTFRIDTCWRAKTIAALSRRRIPFHQGTYIAVHGPSYETPAEICFYRKFGDCIGMSTVHELQACALLGIEPLVASVITNTLSYPPTTITTHEEVLAASKSALALLQNIIEVALYTLRT